jgi:hypothetical protein
MKCFSTFPLFNSHLDLAHSYWKKILENTSPHGRILIDATCGNGHDTAFLTRTALETPNQENTRILAMDKQPEALESTKKLLKELLSEEQIAGIEFHLGCHSSFPENLAPASVSLIVYNLGYLPGSDKTITTTLDTTLKSLQNALPLIRSGGLISITCYPGHKEGKEEEKHLLEFANSLAPSQWSCCHHRCLNRKESPSLLLLQKGR